jgi:hypothetical protein
MTDVLSLLGRTAYAVIKRDSAARCSKGNKRAPVREPSERLLQRRPKLGGLGENNAGHF